MKSSPCCDRFAWSAERDLGHADSMEFVLGKCSNCGINFVNVFCVATGTTGYESVTPADAQQMRGITAGADMKNFMRSWSRLHI
jgi:hypothetical protein